MLRSSELGCPKRKKSSHKNPSIHPSITISIVTPRLPRNRIRQVQLWRIGKLGVSRMAIFGLKWRQRDRMSTSETPIYLFSTITMCESSYNLFRNELCCEYMIHRFRLLTLPPLHKNNEWNASQVLVAR